MSNFTQARWNLSNEEFSGTGKCYNAYMTRPERYQMGFDFGRRHDRSLIDYQVGMGGYAAQEEGVGRFVRAVREEVVVHTPADAARHLLTRVFHPFEAFDQEELFALLLNTKNRITHEAMVYRGTVNSIHIRPAEIFKEAVRVNAPALVLAHVHPSGSVEASPEDLHVTQLAYQTGRVLGIELLDHIIVGKDLWVSLREKGLGFSDQSFV